VADVSPYLGALTTPSQKANLFGIRPVKAYGQDSDRLVAKYLENGAKLASGEIASESFSSNFGLGYEEDQIVPGEGGMAQTCTRTLIFFVIWSWHCVEGVVFASRGTT